MKMMIRDKKHYLKSLRGIGLGSILGLFMIVAMPMNVEELLLGIFGGTVISNITSLSEVALAVCPVIVQLFLFSSIISEDMNQTAVFMFARSYSKKNGI